MADYRRLEDDAEVPPQKRSTIEILKEMMYIGIPSSLSLVSQMLIELINLVFIGHLGQSNLVAAVGMGNLWINICGMSILIGLNTGVATFVS